MTYPEDIVNRALDALGVEAIGDLQEGSPAAKSASRQYVPLRHQLLRAAHWRFARKQITMSLIADASLGMPVPTPFCFEYLYPNDCLQVLFVPNQSSPWVQFFTTSSTALIPGVQTVTPAAMSGSINEQLWQIQAGSVLTINDGNNTESVKVTSTGGPNFTATFRFAHPGPYSISGVTIAGGSGVPTIPLIGGNVQTMSGPFYSGYIPMPFQVMTDMVQSEWGITNFGSGVNFGPLGSPLTVILTNVKSAQLVYTADINSPDEWDALFQEALVAALAAKVAMAVVEDKKIAIALRNEQIAVAKAALTEARMVNGNEGVTTINRDASWTRARYAWGHGGDGAGSGFGIPAYASFGFADGSTL